MSENPGARNRKGMIRRRKTGKLADGSPVPGYDDIGQVWGKFRTDSGIATIRAQQTMANNQDVPVRYTFRIAFRRNVMRGDILVVGEDIFIINHVRHDFAGREWTDLVLEEGANHVEV